MQLHNRLTINDPFIRLLFWLHVFNKMQQSPIPQSIWSTDRIEEQWPVAGKLHPAPFLPRAPPDLLKPQDHQWG